MDEKELDRLEAIIRSMTPEERANPKIIDGSRRRRIARGSGTTVQAVSQLVKQFGQMKKVMKQVARRQDAVAAAVGRRTISIGAQRAEPAASASLRPMSVRVRLTRVGSKKNPIWRVVVSDQRSPRDGRFIETIGHYNPQTEPSTIVIDEERFQHWVARGAQPTNTVKQLVRAHEGLAGHRYRSAASSAAVAEPEARSREARRGRGARAPRPTPRASRRVVEELLEYLARSLVDRPDEVSVESFEEDDGTIVLELHVADDDAGKVIGRGGRTVAALRTVMKAAAVRDGQRVLVDVVD